MVRGVYIQRFIFRKSDITIKHIKIMESGTDSNIKRVVPFHFLAHWDIFSVEQISLLAKWDRLHQIDFIKDQISKCYKKSLHISKYMWINPEDPSFNNLSHNPNTFIKRL